MIHLKGLNGFRAIASLMVVYAHISSEYGDTYKMAGHFVTIFFVLSGFLITYLLLIENKKSTINIRKFYIRRILRIWPLYFLYFIICLLVFFLKEVDVNYNYAFFYLFIMANVPYVLGVGLPLLSHYWSLGTEEQFYLVFPHFSTKKWVFKFIVTSIIIYVVFKSLAWYLRVKYNFPIGFSILKVFQFNSMLIGAGGAILFYKDQIPKWIISPITQCIGWIFILLVILNLYFVHPIIESEIIALITFFLIIGQVKGKGLINLENWLMNFIGRISYGIYLIHPLIIFFFASSNQILSYFLVFTLTIVLAKFSFEYYEKYFLKFKSKFEVVKSQN